jgi:undecaprenyl-diphosphatase
MPLVTLDARVATWLHTHGFPLLTHFMVIVTQVHSVAGVSVMSVIFGIVLWRLKERYWLATLALTVGGGMLLNVLLKDAYERARPHFDDPMVMLDSYSFPSGHTAGAVLFYGVLAAFLVSRYYSRRIRIAIVSVAIFAVMLVALSRMYLGAHYLSDVVAAVCSSTAWLVLCLNTMHDVVRRRMAEAKRP